jgi:pimeloyl-ACP methyl ester carboxylesterase
MSDTERAAELGLHSRHADVNGTRLHYVTGGEGPPLVLLPGWPQTWWSYREVLPKLAEKHRVIAVDLRGMGGSAKPAGGYDKKTMAEDVHELVRHLGHGQVDVVGHDIGAGVAFSLAANHPETVRRAALLDAPHPNESFFELPVLSRPGTPDVLWWFGFNTIESLPEQLLEGRARFLVDHIVDRLALVPDAITDRDRAVYAAAYDTVEAIRASNGWYKAFGRDAEDLRGYEKATTPLLGLVTPLSRRHLAAVLDHHATDVRIHEVAGSGHFLAEEQPDAVVAEIESFLG